MIYWATIIGPSGRPICYRFGKNTVCLLVLADILPRLNFDIFNSLQKRFVCIFCGGAFLILFFLLQRSGIYSKMNISHRVLYRNGGVFCPAVNFFANRKLC